VSQVVQYGRAKIRIEAKGCVDCGREFSYAWESAGAVRVTLNRGVTGHERVLMVMVHRCGRCALRKPVPRTSNLKPRTARAKRGAA